MNHLGHPSYKVPTEQTPLITRGSEKLENTERVEVASVLSRANRIRKILCTRRARLSRLSGWKTLKPLDISSPSGLKVELANPKNEVLL